MQKSKLSLLRICFWVYMWSKSKLLFENSTEGKGSFSWVREFSSLAGHSCVFGLQHKPPGQGTLGDSKGNWWSNITEVDVLSVGDLLCGPVLSLQACRSKNAQWAPGWRVGRCTVPSFPQIPAQMVTNALTRFTVRNVSDLTGTDCHTPLAWSWHQESGTVQPNARTVHAVHERPFYCVSFRREISAVPGTFETHSLTRVLRSFDCVRMSEIAQARLLLSWCDSVSFISWTKHLQRAQKKARKRKIENSWVALTCPVKFQEFKQGLLDWCLNSLDPNPAEHIRYFLPLNYPTAYHRFATKVSICCCFVHVHSTTQYHLYSSHGTQHEAPTCPWNRYMHHDTHSSRNNHSHWSGSGCGIWIDPVSFWRCGHLQTLITSRTGSGPGNRRGAWCGRRGWSSCPRLGEKVGHACDIASTNTNVKINLTSLCVCLHYFRHFEGSSSSGATLYHPWKTVSYLSFMQSFRLCFSWLHTTERIPGDNKLGMQISIPNISNEEWSWGSTMSSNIKKKIRLWLLPQLSKQQLRAVGNFWSQSENSFKVPDKLSILNGNSDDGRNAHWLQCGCLCAH